MGEHNSAMVVGIDLGTTYSRVAVWLNNRVIVIPNENGSLHTPSCVAFTDRGILIGDAAMEHATENPTNTIPNIKRLIKRSLSDTNNRPKILVDGNGKEERLEPEEVTSLLFARLKEIAENYLGEKVTSSVITVPPSFNASQRKAIEEAADIAGLGVVLLDEPIAAVLAYGLEKLSKPKERNVLVFDFGGGSLDVSVVTVQEKELTVKATVESTDLGEQYLDADENPEAFRRLQSVTEQCIDLIAKCLVNAGVEGSQIDDVIVAGGLSNVFPVQEHLRSFFEGKQLHRTVEPDEVMVRGAAIHAAILNGECSFLIGPPSLVSEHANKNTSSNKDTGRYRYNSSNWIWMCSLAAVATVSFLLVPKTRNHHLHTKQWSAAKERYTGKSETQGRLQEQQRCKIAVE